MAVSDLVAPEHLEIQTEDAQKVADRWVFFVSVWDILLALVPVLCSRVAPEKAFSEKPFRTYLLYPPLFLACLNGVDCRDYLRPSSRRVFARLLSSEGRAASATGQRLSCVAQPVRLPFAASVCCVCARPHSTAQRS